MTPHVILRKVVLMSPAVQDIHHYRSTEYAYKPLSSFEELDKLKSELAHAREITLVHIPFWWDGRKERYGHYPFFTL